MYNNQSFYHGSHLKSGLAFVHFAFWENYISFSGWSRERCIDRVRRGGYFGLDWIKATVRVVKLTKGGIIMGLC